jgi:hypothetical protein
MKTSRAAPLSTDRAQGRGPFPFILFRTKQMTSPSLAEPGERLLAALSGNIKKPPRTVADIFGEIVQLADQADKIARKSRI